MKLALAGDTMLGRNVAARLRDGPLEALFADEVVATVREADVFILNLECVVSDQGERWPDPSKPFFFRAPPVATEVLTLLGVDCVNLANNHSLDFGPTALLDTCHHLGSAGIAWVGAGADELSARTPTILELNGIRVGVIGLTDHPAAYAADRRRPGVAFADLGHGHDEWVVDAISELDTDIIIVTPHWGPNMTSAPVPHVRAAADRFRAAGATLVAGHSAHVFHGVADGILFDLGDFIDDYATNSELRNDLGLVFIVTFDGARPVQVEGIPIALEDCHTRMANLDEARWIGRRFADSCADLGTTTQQRGDRLVVDWRAGTDS